jgi:hypothetical protein
MSTSARIKATLKQTRGVMRLIPIFFPQWFSAPGRRLSLMDWKKNVDPHCKKMFYRPAHQGVPAA